MRAVCFHGRRERDMSGDFLFAAQILGAGGAEASLSTQVRTAHSPSPPGSPDRAVIRLDTSPFENMDIPRRYDLEIVCDPSLAVIPPMGNALLPGALLIVNAPAPPGVPASGPKTVSADLSALAVRHDAAPGFALAGGAWAGLKRIAPGFELPLEALMKGSRDISTELAGISSDNLIREAYERISRLLDENF